LPGFKLHATVSLLLFLWVVVGKMSKANSVRKSFLAFFLILVLLPQQAIATTSNGAAIGVGLAALLAGLIVGSHKSEEPTPPPPSYVPVRHVHVYTLREKAEMGNVDAQMKLGENYLNGFGVAQNNAEAFRWFLRAAENGRNGNSVAQLRVAHMYENGVGVGRDNAEALSWYLKSASQGNVEALEAVKSYARQGNQYAQFSLGYLYQNGLGFPQNNMLAASWYQQAADQGNPDAQNSLGIMYENGDGVPRDYVVAFRWYKYSARQGNTYGQANLGRMYLVGRGTAHAHVKAYKWLALAAAKKNAIAEQSLRTLEASLSLRQIEEGQAEARDFVPQPPYSKREMDIFNKLDDIKNFVFENLYPLLMLCLFAGAILARKYVQRSKQLSENSRNAFDKMTEAVLSSIHRLLDSVKQRLDKILEQHEGKNAFQVLEIQFNGPNRFRSWVTLAFCLFLLISNPTEKDFNSYFRGRIEKYGDGNKFAEAVASTVMNNIIERHSYFFFSLFGFNSPFLASFNKDIEDKKFLGIGGAIIPLSFD